MFLALTAWGHKSGRIIAKIWVSVSLLTPCWPCRIFTPFRCLPFMLEPPRGPGALQLWKRPLLWSVCHWGASKYPDSTETLQSLPSPGCPAAEGSGNERLRRGLRAPREPGQHTLLFSRHTCPRGPAILPAFQVLSTSFSQPACQAYP